MPIEWTALPEARRVDAVWVGRVSAADWANFIEDMRKAGITGYAKLHDLMHASVEINASEIRDLARTVNALAEDGGEALGPAAFIIDSARALELVMLFDDGTSTSHRPMAIFPSRQLALDWLDETTSSP